MRRKHRNRLLWQDDGDPLSVVVNLFDVAMVMNMNMTEIFGNEDFTIVKNPGQQNMEIIRKEGKKIETYRAAGQTTDQSGQRGRRLGTAYQLDDGQIIYVPEE